MLLQAVGGGLASAAGSESDGDIMPGTNTIIVGVVFQLVANVVSAGLFCARAGHDIQKVQRHPQRRWIVALAGEGTSGDGDEAYVHFGWRNYHVDVGLDPERDLSIYRTDPRVERLPRDYGTVFHWARWRIVGDCSRGLCGSEPALVAAAQGAV